VLDNDLLGFAASKRGDYPVLLLAAALLEDEEKIRKLGEGVISHLGQQWFLHETPSSFEMTQSLVSEILNYQAMSKAIERAA